MKHLGWALLAALWMSASAAAPLADPLQREALKQQDISRAVMLGAAQAGSRVVAVGERGTVALSDDAGRTWRQARRVPVSVTLTAVRFVNERTGWATGHAGVVLRSDDAGETWLRQLDGASVAQIALRDAQALGEGVAARQAIHEAKLLGADGADKPFLDLVFSDAQHGIVVGAYNLIFATQDGGKTWQSWMSRTGNGKALHLYAIARQGDAVYVAGEQGLLLRSQDSGQTFKQLPSPYAGSWFGLAAQPGQGVVVAGLRGQAWRSNDHGMSWRRVSANGLGSSFVGVAVDGTQRLLLASQSGHIAALSAPDDTLRALPLKPLPPLTGLLLLTDHTLLALTPRGPVRVPTAAAGMAHE